MASSTILTARSRSAWVAFRRSGAAVASGRLCPGVDASPALACLAPPGLESLLIRTFLPCHQAARIRCHLVRRRCGGRTPRCPVYIERDALPRPVAADEHSIAAETSRHLKLGLAQPRGLGSSVGPRPLLPSLGMAASDRFI